MWLVPLEALTEDQLNAVQMSRQNNQVIVGGPGSGKTLALIHRAHRHLADGVDPERMKFLVYTNVLVDYLKSSIAELGIADGLVSTFDSWCLNIFDTHVKGPRPRKNGSAQMDYEAIRVKTLQVVIEKNVEPWLDSVLVDEGQDLSLAAINLLKRASTHVTMALDTKQQIYQDSLRIEDVCEALDVPRASALLLSAYRCTPLIVDVAASFLPDSQAADTFRRSNLLPVGGVETPAIQEFDSEDSEFDALAILLNERALLGQESAVLLPSKHLVEKYAAAMTKRKLNVTTQKKLKFGDLIPMFMTYHSAKGLTVDSVFLPGLIEDNFRAIKVANARKTLLFVGITRATHWVWFGTQPGKEIAELEVMPDLERVRSVTRLKLPEVETTNTLISVTPDESQSSKPIRISSNPRRKPDTEIANSEPFAPRLIPPRKATSTKRTIPVKRAMSANGVTPAKKVVPSRRDKSAGKPLPVKKALPSKKSAVKPKQIKNPDDLLDLL